MRYHVLASDYDGTLASDGKLGPATRDGLARLKSSGRKLIVVTGRLLEDLRSVCPEVDLFDAVVAENGALLHDPATGEVRTLAPPPPQAFVEALRARGVAPLAVGRVIVATLRPREDVVLDVIRTLGLELRVIFNKDAVMVLPTGVDKASGLDAALGALRLSPHDAVGVGDAENDGPLLARCAYAVAVNNAVPVLKAQADLVTRGREGAGVAELCAHLLATDP